MAAADRLPVTTPKTDAIKFSDAIFGLNVVQSPVW